MSQKINTNINLVMYRGKEKQRFCGFDIPVEKSINQLKKFFFANFSNKYIYAFIYHGENVVFAAKNGKEISNTSNTEEKYYGDEISKFKLRIYTIAGVDNPPPFYSSIITEAESYKKAYYELINLHAKGTYRKTLITSIMYMYDANRNEVEVSRFKKDFKTRDINEKREEWFEL